MPNTPTLDLITHTDFDSLMKKFEDLKKFLISTYADVINDDIRRRKMKVCQEAGIFWRKGFEIRV